MGTPENDKDDGLRLAFDEFQLFYTSVEKVTDRRLSTNRWNYSVCTAVIIASVSILGWATSNSIFLAFALVAVIILCLMAIIFCQLWIAQITDFKMLNNAKFEVLNLMAPNISFSSSVNDKRVSYTPFAREWETLKKTKATVEITNTNILALSSSNIEYLIPKAFTWLFVFFVVATVIIAIANWGLITSSAWLTLQAIPTLSPTPTP